MSYRNKTYVAFASEDIRFYRLMEAWRENQHIDFNFYDAHDLYVARDTSLPQTIKNRLRARLTETAKQVVLLASGHCRKKGSDGQSFLAHEIKVILELRLPVVIANLDGSRTVKEGWIPSPLLDANYYTVSTSFQPAIIKYALDEYVPIFKSNPNKTGRFQYKNSVYDKLGL